MPVHIHHARRWTAWLLSIAALSPLAMCFHPSETDEVYVAPVTGRVTLAGRPAARLNLCFDQGQQHCTSGPIDEDGTFHINAFRWHKDGARPGHYKVHLYGYADAPYIPPMYRHSQTSGVTVDVERDWNEFQIDLP